MRVNPSRTLSYLVPPGGGMKVAANSVTRHMEGATKSYVTDGSRDNIWGKRRG